MTTPTAAAAIAPAARNTSTTTAGRRTMSGRRAVVERAGPAPLRYCVCTAATLPGCPRRLVAVVGADAAGALRLRRRIAFRGGPLGGGPHRLDGRFETGPEPELGRRLVDQHPEAPDGGGPALAGLGEPRGQARLVDEVDDELPGAQRHRLNRGTQPLAGAGHPRRRRV